MNKSIKIKIDFKLIKDYISKNNLTIKKFCELCDINYYRYKQFKTNNANIKINVLNNVLQIINSTPNDMIKIL